MRLWRIVAQHRAHEAWTPPRGEHRWTTSRSRVTYAAMEPGLAVAEKLVYLRSVDQLDGFVLVEGSYTGSVEVLNQRPVGWDAWPHQVEVQAIGDEWYQKKATGALQVPSVLLPSYNVILNQEYPEFRLDSVALHDLDRFIR